MTAKRRATIHQYSGLPSCPICGGALAASLARGRKSGKPFIGLKCSLNARHYRAFINDKEYVSQVLERLEAAGENQVGGPA